MTNSIKLLDVIRGKSPQPPCDHTLGIELLYAEDGIAECLWKIDGAFLNANEVVMGGFTTAAADVAMAYALTSLLSDNQTLTSLNLDTAYHRPVTAGEARIKAKVKKLGRQIAYVQATITQNNKRVADAVSSLMIFSTKP